MIVFCLDAHAHFEAENIDDALSRLAEHFRMCAESRESGPALCIQGEINVTPCLPYVHEAPKTIN
jgi:hypothetical protein